MQSTGIVADEICIESKAGVSPEAVIQQIVYASQELLKKYDSSKCAGIGIGSPGVVSLDCDTVSHPPNFKDWTEIKLASEISKAVLLPAKVENDANVAALAEAKFGNGKQEKDFLFIVWGTGIGGGIIVNQQIFRGPYGGAGEIGHITIDHKGPQCKCGNRGCIEAYIGQRYLSERAKQLVKKQKAHSIIVELVSGDLDKIEPKIIAMAAEQGDKTARKILEEAGKLLGYALASAVNLLDIHTIVIGGGVSASPQFVYDAIASSLKSRVLKSHQEKIKVLRAMRGNKAGMLGAAALML